MSCSNCRDYKCACTVPQCATQLVLGTVEAVNSLVYIFITNGAGYEVIVQALTDSEGKVILDLTDPDVDFYSQYQGPYKIWVGLAESYSYTCPDEALTVTSGTDQWEDVKVDFKKMNGVQFSTVTLGIINDES